KMWVQALSQKYLKNDSVLMANYHHGDSYIWKGIVKAREAIGHDFGVRLGARNSSFWYFNWLGTGKLCNRVPYVHISDSNLMVADLWNHNTWNFDCLYMGLSNDLKEEISQVRIPAMPMGEDMILWKKNNDGKYTPSLLPTVPTHLSFDEWFLALLQFQNNAMPIAIFWSLWKWRNSFVFDQNPWPISMVHRQISIAVAEFMRWSAPGFAHMPSIITSKGRGAALSMEVMVCNRAVWVEVFVLRDDVGCWILVLQTRGSMVTALKLSF
ncbi:hypothetical protein Droror1_Dr00002584, partial [Drosera rotundifolia]